MGPRHSRLKCNKEADSRRKNFQNSLLPIKNLCQKQLNGEAIILLLCIIRQSSKQTVSTIKRNAVRQLQIYEKNRTYHGNRARGSVLSWATTNA